MARFKNWEMPELEEGRQNKYGWLVQGIDKFQLGYMTDIGAFTYIQAREGVIIEDYVQVGAHCAIYSESTIDGKRGPVILKKNCRIGANSTILPGVTVGENTIVGAHSLVTQDVPSNSLAYGVPAKKIRGLTEKEIQNLTKDIEPGME